MNTVSATKKIETVMVHAGCESEHNSWSVIPSINLATTFVQEYPGVVSHSSI